LWNFLHHQGQIETPLFGDSLLERCNFIMSQLFNPHWGEQMRFQSNNTINISMVFQGLTQQEAATLWRPFFDWVAEAPKEFSIERPAATLAVPAGNSGTANYSIQLFRAPCSSTIGPACLQRISIGLEIEKKPGKSFTLTNRPGCRRHYLNRTSRLGLLMRSSLAAATGEFLLHFNKGLAGAPAENWLQPGAPPSIPVCWKRLR
jgi:hypothetical protein